MSLGNRLEELRGSLSIGEFVQFFGIHKNTYSNYVKRQSFPDSRFILAVCQKFGVSPNWLLLGAGPKYLDDQPFNGNGRETEDVLHLPLVETWVIGREGEILHDGVLDYMPVRRNWLEKTLPGFTDERLRMLLITRARKDHMAPTVRPGDLVLLDTQREGRDRPLEGDIYLVRLPDGERAFRRVTLAEVSDGCQVMLFPDNTASHKLLQLHLTRGAELHRFLLGRMLWLFRQFCTA